MVTALEQSKSHRILFSLTLQPVHPSVGLSRCVPCAGKSVFFWQFCCWWWGSDVGPRANSGNLTVHLCQQHSKSAQCWHAFEVLGHDMLHVCTLLCPMCATHCVCHNLVTMHAEVQYSSALAAIMV